MAGKIRLEDRECPLSSALGVVGEWWTLLILRDAFLGVTRFEEWQERLGIARNILTKRLDTLVEHGVMERRYYDESRGRADYKLTEKGKALWPVLVTIRQWGDEWITGTEHAPVTLLHTTCGHATTAHLACDHCGDWLERRDIRAIGGPGLDDQAFLRASASD